ncbi:PadR family transcriptional regulator [Herpetosiphon giganteus]|uniref:PadR family transcriptional regulator n=1 Tax=Herpetosiphon giganteus TaxID=2029754 RepID=UPI00195ABB7E|nr:PadR family transcriptional regulator [Herpetosiphon giganteus]MBM7843335.1 DNA-binding PadR family transcriptional regulator [Herpetosiphon giganteus]
MKKLTQAEAAILSLLAEQPRYGYELEQIIQARGMRLWTEIAFSSIYYLLKKLEQAQLVAGETSQGDGRPSRMVYNILPSGRAALQESLQAMLSMPQQRYSSLLLAMANFPLLELNDIINALEHYCAELRAQIERVQQRRAEAPTEVWHIQGLFDYSETMIQAEHDWLTKYLLHIRQQLNEA